MKHYLMRAPAGPFANPSHLDAMAEDLIGGNAGSLLQVYSLARTLMREDVSIDYMNTKTLPDSARIDEINRSCDAFLIPLQACFSARFSKELDVLTEIVRRLQIPCIALGVGLKEKPGTEPGRDHAFDRAAILFCKEILKKSACIGVCGESTGRYLKRLGFTPEKDFAVIGMPDMYLYGGELPQMKEIELSRASSIAIGMRASMPAHMQDFVRLVSAQIPDHVGIAQMTYEQQMMFSGIPLSRLYPKKNLPKGYPQDLSHPLCIHNRICGFVNAQSWMDYLKEKDFVLSARIHTSIAAMLAGVPTCVVATDERAIEIARFHQIPYVTGYEVDGATDIFGLTERENFNRAHQGQHRRFENFLDFLRMNGLQTIYDADRTVTLVPFDDIVQTIEFEGPILPLPFASTEDQIDAIKFKRLVEKREDSIRKEQQMVRRVGKRVRNGAREIMQNRRP